MAACEISPGHVTTDSGVLHSADQAGLSARRGSLRYQGTEYTILDESAPKQALCLSQVDPILELVSYPEALQLVGRYAPALWICPSGVLPLRLYLPRDWMGDRCLLDQSPITLLPGPSPEPALMLNAGLSSGRLVNGIGRAKGRPSTGPTPLTLTIMKYGVYVLNTYPYDE